MDKKVMTMNLLKNRICQNCELFYSHWNCPNSSIIKHKNFQSEKFSCGAWQDVWQKINDRAF
jgi:sulfatase maturation enzyme AslB (radical SAM superfamily)